MSTRPLVAPGEPLSVQLRRRTRAAHVSAEKAFDLPAALADRAGYAALLGRLGGFYRPAERALLDFPGWTELDPPIDVRARARIALLDLDLARLDPDQAAQHHQMSCPTLDSLAVGLGWLYVLEGSALGGKVIAGQARAALGAELPVSFFGSEGRRPGRNWRELQLALDVFGVVSGPQAVEHVVGAATDSFQQFGRWVGGS